MENIFKNNEKWENIFLKPGLESSVWKDNDQIIKCLFDIL